MPLRTRLFIIISIVVLFVLGVSVFLLISSKKKAGVAPAGQTTAEADGSGAIDGGFVEPQSPASAPAAAAPAGRLPSKPLSAAEAEQNAAKQIARIFVERYNTFSTDNNFQNIREVEEIVTPALGKKLSARLASAAPAPVYMVVATVAVATSIAEWGDASAQVIIQARKTTQKSGAAETIQETITVTMAKQGGKWLVDSYASARP